MHLSTHVPLRRGTFRVPLTTICLTVAALIIGCGSSRRVAASTSPRVIASGERISGAWLVTLHTRDLGTVAFPVTVEHDAGVLNAYSRPGALTDVVGWWKSTLAKLLTSGYEHGALMHMQVAVGESAHDTLPISGRFWSPMGDLALRGAIANDRWRAALIDDDSTTWGELEAVRFDGRLPLRDYTALAGMLLDTARAALFDPSLLTTARGIDFASDLRDKLALAQDDADAIFSFYTLAPKLGISHIGLTRSLAVPAIGAVTGTARDTTPEPSPVEVSFDHDTTAVIRFRHFQSIADRVDAAFRQAIRPGVTRIILDLRGVPGGDFSSMRVAAHLIDHPMPAGVFFGAAWWRAHQSAPTAELDSTQLPRFSNGDWDAFQRYLARPGALLGVVTPAQPTFSGPVFVLIDRHTASAAEPLAAFLKESGRATIVGQRSAGAMLSSDVRALPDGWLLRLPTADYRTADGDRIEGIGVAPDVITLPDSAMSVALRQAR